MKLEFFVRDLRMTRKGLEPLVGDTSGYYTFTIAFDRAWEGLVKVVVFQNGDQTAQMIYKGESRLPPQVSGAGELYVACHGYRKEGDQVAVLRTLRMVKPVRLRPSGPMEGDTAQIGTPSLYAQVMAAVGQADAIRQELIAARDAGAFIGPPGQPGKDAEVPDALPNPYALSLDIDGVKLEYDGSKAVAAQVRREEPDWGTAMLKRLQEHDQSDTAHGDIRAAIPEKLPNPHPLSLTIGGVSVEYDGSAAVAANVETPTDAGGGVATVNGVGPDEDGNVYADSNYKQCVTLVSDTLTEETAGLKNYEYEIEGHQMDDLLLVKLSYPEKITMMLNVRDQNNNDITMEAPGSAVATLFAIKIANGRYLHAAVHTANTAARLDLPMSLFYGQLNGASGFERPKARGPITRLKLVSTTALAAGTTITIMRM